ncbi:zinc ribbon domain-containing protein [Okeania sp. KiyG1]|uniref:zinc ribbon domain-containing protein n=1 Tax=Okeania sp. KiyG1 TaxID=2720165 RepID=UPI00192363E1
MFARCSFWAVCSGFGVCSLETRQKIIKVDPKGTSQHCWKCLNKVSKSLSERWHSCAKCGQELDRDYNSALLIQKIGLFSTQEEDITSVKTAVSFSLAEESRALP